MAAFDLLREQLSELIASARRIAEVCPSILSNEGRDQFLEEIRRLRRDLPSLSGQVILHFQGNATLTGKLKHELDCIQQDAVEIADWVDSTSLDIERLHEAIRPSDASSIERWAKERDRAFEEYQQRKQRVEASCNRAQEVAGKVCSEVDRTASVLAAETPLAPAPQPEQQPKSKHGGQFFVDRRCRTFFGASP